MLLGSFASISSWNANSFDYDMAFILFIAGIITLAFGFGFLDIDTLKNFITQAGETNTTETVNTE